MGNSTCHLATPLSHQDISHRYGLSLVQKNKHPTLGETQVYKQVSSGRYLLYLTRSFSDPLRYKAFQEQCEQQQFICQRSLSKLWHFIPVSQNQLCSRAYQVVLLYDYFFDNLQTEYLKRKHQGLSFSEQEIIYIVKEVVKALQTMQGPHGELDLENIMLDEHEEIVLLDHSFLSDHSLSKQDKYCRSRHFKEKYLHNKQGIFLDEQQFQSYDPDSTCQEQPDYEHIHTGDVFSLGLICLQLMRLEDVSMIYDFDNFSIDFSTLDDYQQQLRKGGQYSQVLLDLIQNMLQRKEYIKYSPEQILQHIDKHHLAHAPRLSFSYSQMQSQLLKNNGLTLSNADDKLLQQNAQQTLFLSQIQEHRETENDYDDDCKAFQLNDKDISLINKVNHSLTRQEKTIVKEEHIENSRFNRPSDCHSSKMPSDSQEHSITKMNYIDPKVQMVIQQLRKDEIKKIEEIPKKKGLFCVQSQQLGAQKIEIEDKRQGGPIKSSVQGYSDMWKPRVQDNKYNSQLENRVRQSEEQHRQNSNQLQDLEARRKQLQQEYSQRKLKQSRV